MSVAAADGDVLVFVLLANRVIVYAGLRSSIGLLLKDVHHGVGLRDYDGFSSAAETVRTVKALALAAAGDLSIKVQSVIKATLSKMPFDILWSSKMHHAAISSIAASSADDSQEKYKMPYLKKVSRILYCLLPHNYNLENISRGVI
jgi:hypothetical protein